MSNVRKIAVLVGSLRKESLSRAYANGLIGLAPPSLGAEIVEIGALPLYDADLDGAAPPPAWTAFRERLRSVDGFLFVTPEYNRSIPAPLKNALDVGSRPYGQSGWAGRPGAVVSLSPGALGGFGANHHLRQCLVFLDVPALAQPEVYLSHADKALDGGKIADPRVREFLAQFMVTFAQWVESHGRGR